MWNNVMSRCSDYYDQIPSDTMSKMARSAIYSFTISFVFHARSPDMNSYNLARPLLASAVAALASCIYALTTPFFNEAFGDNRILLHREFFKQIFTISLTSIVVDYATTGKVNLLAVNMFGSLSVNLITSPFESSVAFADWTGDPIFANELRDLYGSLGLDAPPGSSSTFLSFGYFPGLAI